MRFSNRLTSSAACLVGDNFDMTPGLGAQAKRPTVPEQKRILELNPDHAVLLKLKGLFEENEDNPQLIEMAHVLHGQP